MSHPDRHRVILTDFGATLDLCAIKTDNSSVDNHAVIDIFFVLHDWRKVVFLKENVEGEEVFDETIINECDKWIIFGSTMIKGKKMITSFTTAA